MVGAVLVFDQKVIGEGCHEKYGEAHAEVNCINDAKKKGNEDLISKSVLYVSLEPCAHFGKTPPCADLITHHKIPEVVIGCSDSFEQVNGKGIALLEAAGIKVNVGILEKECHELNKRFFTFHEKKRPYVILKWAETANGKIGNATGTRLMITDEAIQRMVHKWRSEESAIMVGTNTALMDDPQLTNRFWKGASPVRVVLDLNLRLPHSLKLFQPDASVIIVNTVKEGEEDHVKYLKMDKEPELLSNLMTALYKLNLQSILIEGGPTLLQSFIEENLWDEARILRNPLMVIEGGVDAPKLRGGKVVRKEEGLMVIVN
jgi:diaminohydroxyphosphoribosylaminopyrimidine deaminase/5-amino-6-(5-phosphoribosylamino)uracil reductase